MAEQDFFTATAQLFSITHLDVPAMELLCRVERSGDDFYQQLAAKMTNPAVAELLQRNGREETGHARRIRKALDIKQPGYVEPPELSQPFVVSLPDNIDAGLFEAIVSAELQGDVGYQTWADNEPNEEIKTLLLHNGREETLHGERVREALALMRAEA